MSAQSPYDITEKFEQRVAEYTGAPYAVAVDCCTNAIFLSLTYLNIKNTDIGIPCRTYMSVPCVIKQTGNTPDFYPVEGTTIKGAYQLDGTPVVDSALSFTSDMYNEGEYRCLSFSGPLKHLKLIKGGMILTDNEEAYKWFKRARFSGRNECSYHTDHFDMMGWNMYMPVDVAARGLLLMNGFPQHNEPLELPYPDLSKFPIYTTKII